MDNVSCDIFDLLYRLGISSNYTGFFQTACAVELCREEPERLLLVSKLVYPDVARQYGTSRGAVESNIRRTSGIAWNNNRPLLERLACKPLSQKPQNTQFLAILLYALPKNRSLAEKDGLIQLFPYRFQGDDHS